MNSIARYSILLMFTMFMNCPARFHNQPYDSMPPLHSSTMFGNKEQISTLLQQGADINERDSIGWTPLFYAYISSDRDFHVAKILLEHGALTNLRDNDGDPLLHLAVKNGNTAALSLLLNQEIDITVTNAYKQTALHTLSYAYMDYERDVVDKANLLHARGIDVNQRDTNGATALHYAVMGSPDLFDWLLRNGAQPYLSDNTGWNILHYAAASGVLEQNFACYGISSTLDFNTLINQQDNAGNTPLHIAIGKAYPKNKFLAIIDQYSLPSIQWLLDNGADVTIRNNEGFTPIDLAKQKNDDFMLSLLVPTQQNEK